MAMPFLVFVPGLTASEPFTRLFLIFDLADRAAASRMPLQPMQQPKGNARRHNPNEGSQFPAQWNDDILPKKPAKPLPPGTLQSDAPPLHIISVASRRPKSKSEVWLRLEQAMSCTARRGCCEAAFPIRPYPITANATKAAGKPRTDYCANHGRVLAQQVAKQPSDRTSGLL
ncbi:hypothetical protein B0I35DRAFT_408751 [Stachybotrys elegans]|uniref:Uncharacterized protein n=1 Tax=Stachybotrys elegans TaxID=80388 RepID=A0A8K0SU96_9HYPO|nr:hypothetical protein B0I35DRAFT_408751 [Stachybotrys elegans]